MSAHKGKSATKAPDLGIVVGSGKRKLRLRQRIALLVLAGVILLASVSYATYVVVQRHTQNNPKTTTKSKTATKVVSLKSADPKINTSQSSLDAALKAAKTDQEKSDIYLEKVDAGLRNKEPAAQVIGYATKAEALGQSAQTALTLGDVYQQFSDKPQAVSAYKLYVSRTDDSYWKAHIAEHDYYTGLIKQLGGQ